MYPLMIILFGIKLIQWHIQNSHQSKDIPGHPGPQRPQLPFSWFPFKSTFVEHQGSWWPINVHLSYVVPL